MYRKKLRNQLINDILFERGEIVYEASGPIVDKDEFVDLKYYTNDGVGRGRKHKSVGLPLSQRFYHWGTLWKDELCVFKKDTHTKKGDKLKKSANTFTNTSMKSIPQRVKMGDFQYCAGRTTGNGVLFFVADANMEDTLKQKNAEHFLEKHANKPIIVDAIRKSIPIQIIDENDKAYIELSLYENTVFDYVMKEIYKRKLNANLPEKYKKVYKPRDFRTYLKEARMSKKVLDAMPSLDDYKTSQQQKIYEIMMDICTEPEHFNDDYYYLLIPRAPKDFTEFKTRETYQDFRDRKKLTPEDKAICQWGFKLFKYFLDKNIDDKKFIERQIDELVKKLKVQYEPLRNKRKREEEQKFEEENYYAPSDKIEPVRISKIFNDTVSEFYHVYEDSSMWETADNIAVYVAGQFCTINNEKDPEIILKVVESFRKALMDTNDILLLYSFNNWTYESDGYKNMLHARYQQGLEMFWPYSTWNA